MLADPDDLALCAEVIHYERINIGGNASLMYRSGSERE
jgi:hypothetical protein